MYYSYLLRQDSEHCWYLVKRQDGVEQIKTTKVLPTELVHQTNALIVAEGVLLHFAEFENEYLNQTIASFS